MKWLASILLLASAPALAQPVIRTDDPHGYGWWLGDELVQRIWIDLPDDVTLNLASLPRPRAVDYWLDLREVAIQPVEGGIELTLRWQNFYSALEPKLREVPPSPLRFSDGTEAMLPGFDFVTSPIRPISARSSPDQLLPDPPYRLVDPLAHQIGLTGSLLAFFVAAVAMAWHQAWGPFRARPARPFTRAARLMKRLDNIAQRRRALHRALDAAFGRVLISAELPDFLSKRPEFAPIAGRLAGFFTASDAAFFGTGSAEGDDPSTLVRDLAQIERGQR
jgi:mxaA protein